ncbi:hypothetical protein CYMTET_29218 [Cymbomonas tetramitiformis]|uniref:RNase H type-1 domain-containing protein n=1 Tax=Cymbomonas tetramitiformis TaxID=36881 RepID=A0AAE0KVD7_9CHLO|nr:hypothetical protein CYMTET_29218 [Cymbomonas tetramitiformis]
MGERQVPVRLFGAGARPTGVMERMLRENDGGVMYTAFRDMVNVGTRLRVEGISGDLVKTLPRIMWGRAKRYRSHSWDAPTLFKDTGVINTMEELFSRKERQYASDGSLNDSRAGCAVVTEDESFMMSAIPGEQSVPRAEAYGLLLALLWQDLGTDITVHTDSKNTIDNVRKIRFDKGRDPRLWRKMENYALYSLIAAIIDMREGRGVVTNVVHVKSHTRRDDLPSVMNVSADRRAKEARDYSCLLREPYRYLPKYYVVSDTEGVSNIKTTYTHALWYYDMDEYLLRSAFRKAGPSQHIKFLEQEGSWVQASKLRRGKGSQHKNNIFAAKLGVGSLPTPRNIQVTNDRHFPDLYPGYACPLHVQDEEVANEHHIFCKCPAMAGVYEEGANRLADKIDGLLPPNRPASTTRTMIKGMLLPSQRKDFLYGKVPEELRRWLVSNIGQASSDKLKGRIRPLVRDFFFDIWCSYTAKIVEGGHDFASRLRKRYEIKVADLKRKCWELHAQYGLSDKAEAVLQYTISVLRRLGFEHKSYTLWLQQALANILVTFGKHDQADTLFQRVIDQATARNLLDVQVVTLTQFATSLNDRGKHQEALRLSEQALHVAQGVAADLAAFEEQRILCYHEEPEDLERSFQNALADVRQSLATAALEGQREEDALMHLEHALLEEERAHGEYHIRVCAILAKMAELHFQLGSWKKGRELGIRCVRILSQNSPEERLQCHIDLECLAMRLEVCMVNRDELGIDTSPKRDRKGIQSPNPSPTARPRANVSALVEEKQKKQKKHEDIPELTGKSIRERWANVWDYSIPSDDRNKIGIDCRLVDDTGKISTAMGTLRLKEAETENSPRWSCIHALCVYREGLALDLFTYFEEMNYKVIRAHFRVDPELATMKNPEILLQWMHSSLFWMVPVLARRASPRGPGAARAALQKHKDEKDNNRGGQPQEGILCVITMHVCRIVCRKEVALRPDEQELVRVTLSKAMKAPFSLSTPVLESGPPSFWAKPSQPMLQKKMQFVHDDDRINDKIDLSKLSATKLQEAELARNVHKKNSDNVMVENSEESMRLGITHVRLEVEHYPGLIHNVLLYMCTENFEPRHVKVTHGGDHVKMQLDIRNSQTQHALEHFLLRNLQIQLQILVEQFRLEHEGKDEESADTDQPEPSDAAVAKQSEPRDKESEARQKAASSAKPSEAVAKDNQASSTTPNGTKAHAEPTSAKEETSTPAATDSAPAPETVPNLQQPAQLEGQAEADATRHKGAPTKKRQRKLTVHPLQLQAMARLDAKRRGVEYVELEESTIENMQSVYAREDSTTAQEPPESPVKEADPAREGQPQLDLGSLALYLSGKMEIEPQSKVSPEEMAAQEARAKEEAAVAVAKDLEEREAAAKKAKEERRTAILQRRQASRICAPPFACHVSSDRSKWHA